MRGNIALSMGLSVILTIASCATPPRPKGVEQAPAVPELAEVASEIGNLAPDFTLQTLQGESVTLSDLHGKMVMLVFWVMECKDCIAELPLIQAVFAERQTDRLAILTVNVGNAAADVQEFVDKNKYTFPVLLDLDGEVCIDYRHGAPATFFIDSNGIIREIYDVAFESRAEIESILDYLLID